MTTTKTTLLLILWLLASTTVWAALPKAPVLPPSGLDADGGDGKVYLEWNPNTEPEVTGYNVYRWEEGGKEKTRMTAQPVAGTAYVDTSVRAGAAYHYAVTAMHKGGETGPSSPAVVRVAEAAATKVEHGAPNLPATPVRPEVKFGNVIRMQFANGHTVVFDIEQMRWCDWQSPDQQHLLYPRPYGNPLDLCSYNNFGFSEPQAATKTSPAIPPRISLNYSPQIENRVPARWIGQSVDRQRVTVSYRIPLWGPGMPSDAKHDSWIWATVRQTWFPIERKINGTAYSGLARRIELELPSFYNQGGYSLALNEAFGVDGSCDGSTTYRAHSWAEPRAEVLSWKRGTPASENGKIRETGNFHPTEPCLQTHPFVFIDHPKATLLLTGRRQFYCTTYHCTNYADQGQDGIWPNFLVDLSAKTGPLAVETFEYLYSPDRSLETPQRYLDARFYFARRLAALYDLPPHLPTSAYSSTLYWNKDKPLEEAEFQVKACAEKQGTDLFVFFHPLWLSASYAMDEAYLTNPNLPENQTIQTITRMFGAKGIKVGYWLRPEFVKSPRANILSDAFFTPYYGYNNQAIPPLVSLLEKRGLPMIRSNPQWMRKGRDGTYPAVANYSWTPMSMSSGWLDRLVWNTYKMSADLGCRTVFYDGGFGGMSGVDYTSGQAVPVQPYWWRLFRLMKTAGLDICGECGVGWGGGFHFGPVGKELEEMPWWFANGVINPPDPLGKRTGAVLRKLHQVYGASSLAQSASLPEHRQEAVFFASFVKKHGPPDRVVLKNLRRESGKWAYDGVEWQYADGRKVEYPNL
jgi:hypothetical protein